jgi:hypothetical protein
MTRILLDTILAPSLSCTPISRIPARLDVARATVECGIRDGWLRPDQFDREVESLAGMEIDYTEGSTDCDQELDPHTMMWAPAPGCFRIDGNREWITVSLVDWDTPRVWLDPERVASRTRHEMRHREAVRLGFGPDEDHELRDCEGR